MKSITSNLPVRTSVQICFLSMLFAMSQSAAFSQCGNGYQYCYQVTFNHNQVGVSDSVNFPALISSTSGFPWLKTVANGGQVNNPVTQTGGGASIQVPADVIFTSDAACSTLLSWEYEDYSPTTGAVDVWVRIPSLSHTTDTTIYACAGKSTATTWQGGSSATAWSNGFQAVWHLPTIGSVPGVTNSTTSTSLPLTASLVTVGTGEVGGGANNSGAVLSGFTSNPAATTVLSQTPFTYSMWVNLSSFSHTNHLVSINNLFDLAVDTGGHIVATVRTTASYRITTTAVTLPLNSWHYVAVSYATGSAPTVFLDGAIPAGSQTSAGSGTDSPIVVLAGGSAFAIGAAAYNPYVENYIGALDEVRLANITTRSVDWILAEYNNQKQGSTFYTVTPAVGGPPAITTQPTNVPVTAGQLASFTAAASGNPAPTVQWQVSTDGGASFSSLGGSATSPSYIFTTASTDNGKQFRAVFTNPSGVATTNAATLTVSGAPTITTQPSNVTVTAGQPASFTAAASGNPVPTVQWQVSTNAGVSFSNMSGGATSPTYSLTTASIDNGKLFRAVFTNPSGTVTTTAVTLTVATTSTTSPSAVPPSPQLISASTQTTFTFTIPPPQGVSGVTGINWVQLNFQTASGGQFSIINACNFNILPDPQNLQPYVQTYTDNGALNTQLNLRYPTSTMAQRTNSQCTLAAESQMSVTSNNLTTTSSIPITFTLPDGIGSKDYHLYVITSYRTNIEGQPPNYNYAQSVDLGVYTITSPRPSVAPPPPLTIQTGAPTTFTFSAPPPTGATGVNSVLLNFQTQTAGPTSTVNACSMKVLPDTLAIQTSLDSGALNATLVPGTTSTTVAQRSNSQCSLAAENQLSLTNINLRTVATIPITFILPAATAPTYYHLYVVMDYRTASSASNPVTWDMGTFTIIAGTLPLITLQPSSTTVPVSATATFSASASGSPQPSVQWQVSSGGAPFANISAATSTTYNAPVSLSANLNQYRAIFTNIYGSATTSPATLTIATNTTSLVTASRLLTQAAFGPNSIDSAYVRQIGKATWLTQQLTDPGVDGLGWLQLYTRSSSPMGSGLFLNDPNDLTGTPAPSYGDSLCPPLASGGCLPGLIPSLRTYVNEAGGRFLRNSVLGSDSNNSRADLRKNDQLRQRVAFAWSELFVVNRTKGLLNTKWSKVAPFQEMLYLDAFQDFTTILREVTKNPTMGEFLDMRNSVKANLTGTVSPNENYARELLQLFTIGINPLGLNGTVQTGLPNYDQPKIQNFAVALTGWNEDFDPGSPYHNSDGFNGANAENYLYPMVPVDANYDLAHANTHLPLLQYLNASPQGQCVVANRNGQGSLQPPTYVSCASLCNSGLVQVTCGSARGTLSNSNDAVNEVDNVMLNIMGHPNVAPFISKFLIQHLVTSNPSSTYIQNVATVFNMDSNCTLCPAVLLGAIPVKGNIKAVIWAILNDQEATAGDNTDWTSTPTGTSTPYGHLQEPWLWLAGVLRGLNATQLTDGSNFEPTLASLGQPMYDSSSVFNFYSPTYPIPASVIPPNLIPPAPNPRPLGPEFQIQSPWAAVTRANLACAILQIPGSGCSNAGISYSGFTLNFTALNNITDNLILVNSLDSLLTYGAMPVALKTSMTNSIKNILDSAPTTYQTTRAQLAAYLIVTSGFYQVIH